MIDLQEANYGDEFVTRKGKAARFVGRVPGAADNTARYVMYYPEENRVANLWRDGKSYILSECPEEDVIKIKSVRKKLTGYLMVCKNGDFTGNFTEKPSNSYAKGKAAILNMADYDIEYEEGQGFD